MLTTKGWLYLLICFLLLGISIYMNKVEFYISFVILASYFIVSIINVGLDPMRFEVRRYSDQSYFFEGDSMEVNVRVKRGKGSIHFLKVYQIRDVLPDEFALKEGDLCIFSDMKENLISFKVRCGKRGVFSLGSIEVSVTDYISLFRKKSFFRDPFELVVFPRTHEINLTLNQGDLGAAMQPFKNLWNRDFDSFHSLKDYEQGEDSSLIHWKTSARLNRLMVKEYESEQLTDSRYIATFLDLEPDEELEGRIEVASSVCYLSQMKEKHFSLHTQGRTYGYRSGRRHLFKILRYLAAVDARKNGFIKSLNRFANTVNPSVITVIITSRNPSTVSNDIERMLKNGGKVFIIFFSPVGDETISLQTLKKRGVKVYEIEDRAQISNILNGTGRRVTLV